MSISVRIYKPAKTAMQSGTARTKQWKLEFEQQEPRFIDPIMGWTGSTDMRQEVQNLYFDTKGEAVEYAKSQHYDYKVFEPKASSVKPKSYAANFT